MTSCSHVREHLSADLDGERGPSNVRNFGDETSALAAVYRHLETCAGCSRWFADVTRINRLARTAAAEPGPGFSTAQLDELLKILPRPASDRRSLWRTVARAALAVVGVVQITLGAWPLFVPHVAVTGAHAGDSLARVMHLSHEYSAWSLAVGVAFLVGAAWTRHLAGALPVLGSFVAVLVTVSTIDIVAGRVAPAPEVTHGVIVLGLGLIVAIVVGDRRDPRRRPSQSLGDDRLHDARAEAPVTWLRKHHGMRNGGKPAAHHRAA